MNIKDSEKDVKEELIGVLTDELLISKDISELIAELFLVHDAHSGWDDPEIPFFTITNYEHLINTVKELKLKYSDTQVIKHLYIRYKYIKKGYASDWGVVSNLHFSCTSVRWH